MGVLETIFAVCVVAPVGIGYVAHRRGWSLAGGPARWGETVAGRIGPVPGALACLVVGTAVTFAVALPLGVLARWLQHPLDDKVYQWVHPRVPAHTQFTKLNDTLTITGNRPEIEVFALIALLILIVAYQRRWWIPVLLLAVMILLQRDGQTFLAHAIHRGHPPLAGTGTYPSGGVSRLITVYGTIAALALALLPTLGRKYTAWIWTLIALFGILEAYTRIYLSQHWLSDTIGGLIFGALLLLTAQATLGAVMATDDTGRTNRTGPNHESLTRSRTPAR